MRLWAGQDDPHPPAGRGSGLVVVYGVQPAGPPVWPGVRRALGLFQISGERPTPPGAP